MLFKNSSILSRIPKSLAYFSMAILLIGSLIWLESCQKNNGITNEGLSTEVEMRDPEAPCNAFPGLAGISFSTVKFGENQQIADMYTMIPESEVAPLAEQLIAMHENQGQQATLNYMRTTLGYSDAEVGLLNSFLTQVQQIDFENLSVSSIETFANGYRDYICTTYSTPPTPPGSDNPGDGEVSTEQVALYRRGHILVNTVEGDLKALLAMQSDSENVGGGASDRNTFIACAACLLKSTLSTSYYSFSGAKYGALIGSVFGPQGAVVGAYVGAIAGGLYGANNALKTSSCKTCNPNDDGGGTPTCVMPTKIAVRVKSCNEVEFGLVGQSNLPNTEFDWFNINATPESERTAVPLLNTLIPSPSQLTKAEVLFKGCSGNQVPQTNSFNLRSDFLRHGNFSVMANSSSIQPGGKTEIIVTPGKPWNSELYSISYAVLSGNGYVQNWSVSPNNQFIKEFVALNGTPTGIATIRVTITNLCLNTTEVATVTININ